LDDLHSVGTGADKAPWAHFISSFAPQTTYGTNLTLLYRPAFDFGGSR
jgi:hypothetical protein